MKVNDSSSQYNSSVNIQEQSTETRDVETENKVDNTQEQQSATQTQKESQSNNNRDPYDLNLDRYADKYLRRETSDTSVRCNIGGTCATCGCYDGFSPTYSHC